MRGRLLLLLIVAALAATGCGGAEQAAPVAETVEGSIEAPKGETGETETETEGGGTETETETGTGTETGGEDGGGEDGGGEDGGDGDGDTETTGSGDEEEQEGGEVPEGDPTAGEDVFASSGCGSCHALEAAGSNGNIGPDLDEAKPDYERAVDYVTNGKGAMPAFKGQLNDEDIANVAAYVVESTKG
jgi:cytochrome c553